MPHWRSMMDRDYLGAWDVPTDKTATIERVDEVRLPGAGEIKANRKPVLSFKGTAKRLIVGATIGKVIAAMYGDDTDAWVGKRITLYATKTRSKGGEQVDCVRVRPMIPKAPGAPIPSQPVDEAMREQQIRGAGDAPTNEPREPGSDDT